MKQHNALALLALLCLSFTLQTLANNSTKAASKAKLTQGPADGYAGREQYPPHVLKQPYGGPKESPEQPYAYEEDFNEEPKCPDPQPADSVKDVYRAHCTFQWRELAAYAAEQSRNQRVQASPKSTKEQATISAVDGAGFGSKSAKPEAVIDEDYQLPTSLEQQGGGFLGTYDRVHFPPSEALAVGGHPIDDELVFVLHAINGQAEVFPSFKDGRMEPSVTPTRVPLMDIAKMTQEPDIDNLQVARVAAFFDEHKKRYILMWSTHATDDVEQPPPLFLASSLTQNPLGLWVVWALDLRPDVAQGVTACAEQPASAFHLANLQASYSKDGIFIGAAATCTRTDANGDPVQSELSALYILSKSVICEPPYAPDPSHAPIPEVPAAVYFAHRAWYRSVAETELAMIEDEYEPFNSYIAPARPQNADDLDNKPLFAMKVTQSHLSIATLTGEPLDKMKSVETAPMIEAVVLGKGADFTNYPDDEEDGQPYMPQPGTDKKLVVAGLGMPTTHGGVVYWATQCNGLLYLATGEYWGDNSTRVPSIYWAVIKPTDDICHLSREDQGMVASDDGLALAYPVIVAAKEGGAVLAYSYSGADKMADGTLPAYPGVATTMVGSGYGDSGVDVVKLGAGSLTFSPPGGDPNLLPWGYSSAASVCGNIFWFAVPFTAKLPNNYGTYWYASWISMMDISGPDASRV